MALSYPRMRDLFALDPFFTDVEPMFGRGWGLGGCPIDIQEKRDHFEVRADCPGFRAEDLDVRVHDTYLEISGNRIEEGGEGELDAPYHRRERVSRSFSRRVGLPSPVNADHVDARLEQGVLTLRVPKKEVTKPRGRKVVVTV